MPRNKLAGKGKSTLSPEARKKKLAYDAKFSAKPEQKRNRAETNRANRKAGTYGKMTAMGKDRSHTKSGKLVLESSKVNRGRNGKDGKSTKK
jgi:hypothetical protein